MQIIQTIRNRGTVFMAILIALCLLGFILMDSSMSGGSLFGGGPSNNIGSVNGKNIDVIEFNKKLSLLEQQEEAQTGRKPAGAALAALRERLWNQTIGEELLYKEAGKLGIDFTPKQLSHILLSNNPQNPLLQEQGMIDPTTGKLDVAKAQQTLANIKKANAEQTEAINAQLVDPLKLSTIAGKYVSMLGASAYYPSWMQEKDAADMNNFANISYVSVPYLEVSDSTVKVTDADVNAYVQKHKDLFKQEEGRKISYVAISQLPSSADSVAQMNEMATLKNEFAADNDAKTFVARSGSLVQFQDQFLPKDRIPTTHIDSIVNLPAGSVYGPYADRGAFLLAKNLGSKIQPDSASAKHILIPVMDPQTGTPIRSDSSAKQLADSIYNAIKGGANFNALAAQYSADGSAQSGGDLGTFAFGSMVPEFNDYVFNNNPGSLGVVQTQFGYHVINVTKHTALKPAYKIAFIAKEIIPSENTINEATLLSTRAAATKNAKELSDFASKNGLSFIQVPVPVGKNDYGIGAMQDARQLVKWAFEPKTKVGQISEPFNVGDEFIVATVDGVYQEGVQDAATARSGAEAMIRNTKKAEIIKGKLGANPTLEAAAAAYGKQVLTAGADSTLTMASSIINGLGIEPEVIGAAFNKAYQAKPSPAIAGTSAVYVIKVNSIGTKSAQLTPEEMQLGKLSQMKQAATNWFDGLKKGAKIKDDRSVHF